MRIRSLGYATDLAILELGGSLIERKSEYWKISSPHAPTYYWENFLLVDVPVTEDSAPNWQQRFEREFPDARHFALGINDREVELSSLRTFADLGADVDSMTVLSCSPGELVDVEVDGEVVRAFSRSEDWEQALELGIATRGDGFAEGPYRAFFSNYLDMHRSIVERDRGDWWGAFVDGKLVSQAGIIDCGDGLARYQMVSTHPEFRRRGLAKKVVASAGHASAEHFQSKTLVIVADPAYHAISIYRDLGFRETERQVSIERVARPDQPAA